MRLKQTYYDQGEKPCRLLAWCIKQQQTVRAITNIEDTNGNTVVDPLEINTAFKNFYEKLYRSEYTISVDIQTEFLYKLNIPKISEENKKNLDKQLSITEISKAMVALKAGKTAGLDGLPTDI